jgi:hypothetical protein
MTDLIEKYAIIMAEGNNGGTWATHYTDSQKDLWRARAEKLIEDVLKVALDETKSTTKGEVA